MYYSYVLSTTPHIRYTEADFVDDDDVCMCQPRHQTLSLSFSIVLYVYVVILDLTFCVVTPPDNTKSSCTKI